VAQVVEHLFCKSLLCKGEALSSNPSLTKGKKSEIRGKGREIIRVAIWKNTKLDPCFTKIYPISKLIPEGSTVVFDFAFVLQFWDKS
jgi:hypothetical protein